MGLLVCGYVSQAQRESDHNDEVETTQHGKSCSGGCCKANDMKPGKGDVTAEFGLSGGIINSDFHLNEGTSGLLRGRFFLSNSLALRVGVNIGFDKQTTNFYGTGTFDGEVGTEKNSSSLFLLNVGIEKHFAGTKRLSPYVGADLMFGSNSQKSVLDNTDGSIYVDDFNSEVKGPGAFGFGLRGVIGADYYFAKHVYLGVEGGLGFMSVKDGETTTTVTTGGTSTTVTTESAGSNFGFSPSVITGVRIGFVF